MRVPDLVRKDCQKWYAPVGAAQQTDVILGRVTGPDNRPIDGVQVTATSVWGGVNRTARTSNEGRFTITFPGGDGDYIVTMNRIGYAQRR